MPARFDLRLLPACPDFQFECALWEKGLRLIAGVDEAGRGALAGPVAAAAVIFPPDPSLVSSLAGVDDSKRLTPRMRALMCERVKQIALGWGVGMASNLEVDDLGILPATRLAVRRALEQLPMTPEHLLVDFLNLPDCALPQTPLVKGDQRSLSIAAASILAKTIRDAFLCRLDQHYSGYGFARHKGYGTRAHLAALDKLGPSPVHRRSFRIKSH